MTASDWIHVPRAGQPAPGRETIGGKAAALAALAHVAGPHGAEPEVPRWIALTTGAFAALARPAAEAAGPERARGAVLALEPPRELGEALREALREAGLADERLAVRSSAAGEDAAEASFAGQYESVLGVPAGGGEALWRAIACVWASAFSDRARAYASGRDAAAPTMAVLVQAMIDARASGVAFDADPVSGDRDTIVVSAVPGLGESLVSGEADADTYRLALVSGAWTVRERSLVQHARALVMAANGTERVTLGAGRAGAPALEDAQAAKVAEWTRAISLALGSPQDVEWALAGDPVSVMLLQSRPITTLVPHDPGAPAGLPAGRRIWDNSNIVESYSGVTSPLTFTFARAVYEDAYRQFCRLMGVPETVLEASRDVFANMLGLVRGRVYYQLLNWYRTLALLPGFSFNRAFMEKMMGVRERLEDPPPAPGSGHRALDLVRLVWMVARMAAASAGLGRAVPAFHARVERVLGPLASEDLARRTPGELRALYQRLERELLAHWRAPLVNDFFAMLWFGALGRAIERWLPGAPATLANDLLCGEGGIISTEPARAIMELARGAAADPALRAEFESGAAARELWSRLHSPPMPPAFAAALDRYVARFGDRCMDELKLETVTLREDPGFLLAMVRAYLAQGAPDASAARERERAIRRDAERRVDAALGGPRRLAFRWVLGQARGRIRDRENMRFERTRVFGLVRRIMLAIGSHHAAAGRIDEPRDAFLLTLEEALAESPPDLRSRIASRRRRADLWRAAIAPPERFETHGAVGDWLAFDPPELAAPRTGTASAGDVLQGTGCCPGIVRASVRVVHDPAHASELAGRILVAERTDPGWTVLFPAVAGLLVQRGSLLSHSAIVAREMGIPCVVGIAGLLDALHDGDIVELDGTSGGVRRVSGESAA
jgi:pyruvate,water dikinase